MAGRPRSFDKDAALDVAVEQFWRDGYDATTIASLTSALGVAAPSLYAAFGDKEQLFEAAATCYLDRLVAGVDTVLAAEDSRRALTELLHLTAAAHSDPGTPLGCLLLTEPRLVDQRAVVEARIAARVRRGIDDGDVDPAADPERVAAYLVAVMRGMSGLARDGGRVEDLRSVADLAVTGLVAALGAPTAHPPATP